MKELFTNERFLIAVFVMALFAGSIIVMSFVSVPEQNQEVVIQLVGGVNMLAGMVVGAYFKGRMRSDKTGGEDEGQAN